MYVFEKGAPFLAPLFSYQQICEVHPPCSYLFMALNSYLAPSYFLSLACFSNVKASLPNHTQWELKLTGPYKDFWKEGCEKKKRGGGKKEKKN